MKKLAILFLLVSALSCKKDSVDTDKTAAPGKKMIALTANNKPNMKFEYQNDLLLKEGYYFMCETNPSDEYSYEYRNGHLSRFTSTMRSLYSSTLAICNPAAGIKSEETFQYNTNGQITSIARVNSTTEFTYNAAGLVVKQALVSNNKSVITTFEYDSRGNLVKETNANGEVAYYEYDNKVNPYYQMNQRPQWISAFNKSPNNVIKATGRVNFERTFKYDFEGYPTEVSEDNGITYQYEYRGTNK